MAVIVRSLNILANSGAGGVAVTSFSDSMAIGPPLARNLMSPPTDNWLFLVLSGDTPTAPIAMGNFIFGQALSGGGNGMAAPFTNYGAATYGMATGICPAVAYVGSPIYNAKQKFVQFKFDSFVTQQTGIGIMNFLDTSGIGVAGSNNICHDCYLVDMAGQPLRLLRFNSGAAVTTLQAASALALNDVVRASFDFTNPAQVTIVVKKNGVTQYTIVDNAAARLPSSGLSFPVIASYAFSGGGSFLSSQFSCGVGL